MLNKKFASIRATANVKTTEKRSSVASSSSNMLMMNQRLSQSQSMEMYGMNYHHQQQLQQQQANNEMLMNMTKDSLRSTTPSSMQYEHQQRAMINSSPATPIRSAMMMKSPAHPYVNLMHQQFHNGTNTSPHQHLQYQNNSNNTSSMSFGSPIMIDSQNQSWNSISSNQPSPLAQHYTASQIYMRPKNLVQQSQIVQQHSPQLISHQQVSTSPKVTHKKVPPEVPKRLPSTVPTSVKKPNGLSRSSKF